MDRIDYICTLFMEKSFYMKKIIASSAIIVALASCSKSGVEITGNVQNAGGQMIYLSQMDLNKTFVVDSAEVEENGDFKLRAPKNNQPTFFVAKLNDGKNQVTLLTDSLTEELSFSADLKAENWQSSVKFNDSEVNNQINDFAVRVDDLQKEFVAIASNQKLDADERSKMAEMYLSKIKTHKEYVGKFVFDHPRSFASYYALFQSVVDMPLFDIFAKEDLVYYNALATSLKMEYPTNERVSDLCNRVLLVRHAIAQQKKQNDLISSAVEVNSPNLSIVDKDGNKKNLSDLRGKIVILQFWAAQDKESRRVNRQLVRLYNQYKSQGLEIYQVSIDTSKLMWESAVETDGLVWTNVCDMLGLNSPAVHLYNVTRIPSNYIIDRDGSLIGKDLFDTRLDNRMAELFK